MKTFLNMIKTFTRNYTQTELAEELTTISKDLDPDKPKKYSHSTISKLLNGKQPFTRKDIDYIIELLSLTKDEKKQLIELFPIYEYEYHLKPKEINDIKAILKIFESFQKLCIPTLPLTLQKDLSEITMYPDGIYDSEIEIQTAIYQTLCNEFQKETPRMDVFLPQKFDYYYRQMKILLPDAINKKNISIRQILTYSNSKNLDNSSEFNLLTFLPTIYYLTFISPGSYVFYYHYTDSVVSEVDGLLFPYYICTSNCLIRLSQHQKTAWVSHNPKDIEAYQMQFNKRINKTRPLMKKSNLIEYIDLFSIPENVLNHYYSPAICPIKLIPSDFDVASLLRPKYPYTKDELLSKVQKFMQIVILPCSYYHYYSKEGLYEFAKTGILHEYPKDMFFPVTPKDRILMLQNMFNSMNQKSPKYKYFIINNQFPNNNKYCLGISDKCVTSYALGFGGIENLEMSVITNPMLVNKFRFFFEDYLPHSELIYSKENALKIVQTAIEIAESKL